MVMERKEYLVLSLLRKDARDNLTRISRKTGIPVSTLFEKLKKYEQHIITKHTSLLDFSTLGFNLRVQLVIKASKADRERLQQFLVKTPTVNNLYRVTNGSDFIVEAIFKDMTQFQDFTDQLDEYSIKAKQQYYILEDLKRESFLADQELLDILI